MRIALQIMTVSLLTLVGGVCTANGGGSMGGGGAPAMNTQEQTPEQRAILEYGAGVRLVKAADKAENAAAAATDPKKKDKAIRKARDAYAKARDHFVSATMLVPQLADAWNYVGYTRRKLGDAANALIAYDQALRLKPGYLDAIEYRGVAYLGLDRIGDAREAYLQLFPRDAALAAKLLAAMRQWVDGRRAAPEGTNPAALDEFAHWVEEREHIAATTAGLVPAGQGRDWH
jgi:tetratricopeptide (TPR) repeat protein